MPSYTRALEPRFLRISQIYFDRFCAFWSCRPVRPSSNIVLRDIWNAFVPNSYWAWNWAGNARCDGKICRRAALRRAPAWALQAKKKTPTRKEKACAQTDALARWIELYAARQYLGVERSRRPACACRSRSISRTRTSPRGYEGRGIDDEFTTPWEPGLRDGPTSARFAVVDYDSTSNMLTPPADLGPGTTTAIVAPDGTTFSIGKRPRLLPVSPAQRLGDRSEHARLLRERLRRSAAGSAGRSRATG